jgi:hypothetical protein
MGFCSKHDAPVGTGQRGTESRVKRQNSELKTPRPKTPKITESSTLPVGTPYHTRYGVRSTEEEKHQQQQQQQKPVPYYTPYLYSVSYPKTSRSQGMQGCGTKPVAFRLGTSLTVRLAATVRSTVLPYKYRLQPSYQLPATTTSSYSVLRCPYCTIR